MNYERHGPIAGTLVSDKYDGWPVDLNTVNPEISNTESPTAYYRRADHKSRYAVLPLLATHAY